MLNGHRVIDADGHSSDWHIDWASYIPKELQRLKGGKYLFASQPQMMDMKPINKLVKKILAGAKKN